MDSADMQNRVLVLGCEGTGRDFVLRSLYAISSSGSSPPSAASSSSAVGPSKTVSWTPNAPEGVLHHGSASINNKYYSASVDIFTATPEQCTPPLVEADGINDAILNHYDFYQGFQAIIYVVDSERESSFRAIQKSCKTLSDLGYNDEFELSICVVNMRANGEEEGKKKKKALPAADAEATWLEEVPEWCSSLGYEHLPFHSNSCSGSARSSAEKDSEVVLYDRQAKEGVDRIMEALECVMWPCMTQKPRMLPGSSLAAAAAAGGASSSSSSSSSSQAKKEEMVEDEEEERVEAVEEFKFDIGGEEEVSLDDDEMWSKTAAIGGPLQTAMDRLEMNVERLGADLGDFAPQLGGNKKSKKEGEGDQKAAQESEGAAEEGSFDQLLQQVMQFRMNVVTGNISDEQRRERAAALATKMMQAFGINGDSDDEEGLEEGAEDDDEEL